MSQGLSKGLLSKPGWTQTDLKAIKEAEDWIGQNSAHKIDCHEYTASYMKDPKIVNRISDWITFQSIVKRMGYKEYSDICDNEWYENPMKGEWIDSHTK